MTLEYLLRKTPGMIKHFQIFIDKEEISIEQIETVYNKIRTYKQLFSGIFDNNLFSSFETLLDFVDNTIIESQKNRFIKQFISNKYKHLVNEETVELFNIIRKEFNVSKHSEVKNLVLTKIASFRNVTDFNLHVRSIITSLGGDWSVSAILEKVSKVPDTEVVYWDESIVIVNTQTYNSMKRLGSENWCIVRSESTWKHYIENNSDLPNRQFIIYDTYYPNTDYKSMIGVTIKNDFNQVKIKAAHFKNDNKCNDWYLNDLIKHLSYYNLNHHIVKSSLTVYCYARYGMIEQLEQNSWDLYWSNKILLITCAINSNDINVLKYLSEKKWFKRNVCTLYHLPLINKSSYEIYKFIGDYLGYENLNSNKNNTIHYYRYVLETYFPQIPEIKYTIFIDSITFKLVLFENFDKIDYEVFLKLGLNYRLNNTELITILNNSCSDEDTVKLLKDIPFENSNVHIFLYSKHWVGNTKYKSLLFLKHKKILQPIDIKVLLCQDFRFIHKFSKEEFNVYIYKLIEIGLIEPLSQSDITYLNERTQIYFKENTSNDTVFSEVH